jgi:hypothetical protein
MSIARALHEHSYCWVGYITHLFIAPGTDTFCHTIFSYFFCYLHGSADLFMADGRRVDEGKVTSLFLVADSAIMPEDAAASQVGHTISHIPL